MQKRNRPTAGLSAFCTVFHYVVALMPTLYLLNVPRINVSLGTLLLIVFLPYSFFCILNAWTNEKKGYKELTKYLPFALFYLYLCLRSDGNLSFMVLAVATLIHMCGMLCGSVQIKHIQRIMVSFAMCNAGLVLIQTVVYYLLDWHFQFIPQFLVHEQFRGSHVFRELAGLYRPSALFLEPAHFAQYCCFALISVLFPVKGKADIERAAVIAVGCVLTTSGMGMMLSGGIFVWYFVEEYLVSGKIKKYSPKQIACCSLILIIGVLAVCQVPFVKTALLRVFSSVDGYNAIVGRLGLWKLKDAIGTMDFTTLLVGYGNSTEYGYYLPGLADTIYKFGLIGVCLELVCFANLMMRKRTSYVWCTCMSFLLLFCVAHLISFFVQVFYFGIVIADVVSPKPLDDEQKYKGKVSDKQIKMISYRILKDVADFCESHGIQYYLACGTALGAIRHGGFIPWDDDVDISMPRGDYERFLDMYQSERNVIFDTRYCKNYPYGFAKVCDRNTVVIEHIEEPCKFGVYVDIFPIDGLPNDAKLCRKHMKKLHWDFRVLAWKRMPRDKDLDIPHKIILVLAKSVLHIVPIRFLLRKLEYDVKKYSYTRSNYVGHLVSPSPWGSDIKPKRVFENPVRHRFEDREFFVPGQVDEYLRLEYVDYMQLPPEEKRVAKHDFVAYYK